MATNERPRDGGLVGAFLNGFFLLIAIAVLLGIGYSFWPKIQAAYYAQPVQVQVQPTAQVVAPAPQPVPVPQRPVIVQSVPQGQAPQPVQVQQPAPAVEQQPITTDNAQPAAPVEEAPPADPPARPIVIVLHENDGHGAPIVTGSGACAVAAKGARRCGK